MSLSPDELIELMERDLGSSSSHPFPEGTTLFHYTDASALLGLLRDKKIWATHYRYLNDSDEMHRGEDIVQQMAETLSQEASTPPLHKWVLKSFAHYHRERSLTKEVDVFVASFSEDGGNQLSQWRGYAANGAGYSIGFSRIRLPEGVREDATSGFQLCRCEYDDDQFRSDVRTRLNEILRTMDSHAKRCGIDEQSIRALAGSAIAHSLRSVAAVIPRLKHQAFREEKEWRLVGIIGRGEDREVIQYRPSHRGVVPYVEIDLCEETQPLGLSTLFVGPTQDPDAGKMTATMLLNRHGYPGDTLVRLSGIPFRG